MARTMKKFSAGGAQGRYDRRMADIEKDRKIALAKGKNADVVAAKAAQRIADAKDDLAKRTGADRTATRKAEYDAEQRLSRTRKFGADKPAAAPAATPVKAPAATTAPAAATEAPKAKPKTTREEFNAAFSAARAKAVKEGRDPNKEIFTFRGQKKVALMATAPKPAQRTNNSASTVGSNTNTSAAKAASTPVVAATATNNRPAAVAKKGLSPAEYERALKTGTIPGTASAQDRANIMATLKAKRDAAYAKPANKYAKGGKVKKEKTMKYAKGGSTPNMNNKPKKPMPKEPITGGANTVPLTPQRKEFLKELEKRNAKPGMAKGGKAATKFGAAMKKKSADTKGRAMMKFAKGGSIDGCAIKGKTKTSMVKMKKGGSC